MRAHLGRAARTTAVVLGLGATVAVADGTFTTAPHPVENPPTEAKRVLGKALFFEEQLSSDDTVACATCHVMTAGGSDPRKGRHPGKNGTFGDLGDVLGSPGVAAMDESGRYRPSAEFGADVQVTPRTAPTTFAAAFEESVLWDGRAPSQFVDPVTGEVVVAEGGALESQALLPLTNELEMGHASRDLAQVTAKLAASRPLALASDLTPDLAAALADDPDYPELFRRAFGDPEITPARIAMAIATYERTLVPDDTPYDRFLNGDTSALDGEAFRGLEALTRAKCTKCHEPPLFSDGSFRATGVRPPSDDLARAGTTSDDADRGRFKVPTLRNVALKTSFFHDGQRTDLGQAISFYAVVPGPVVNGTRSYRPVVGPPHPDTLPSVQFTDNQDPVMTTIDFQGTEPSDIVAFLRRGLVDPRVADAAFPFDAPTLTSQRPDRQVIVRGTGLAGPAGVPAILVRTPAFAGNDGFVVSVAGGSGGDTARLVSWQEPTDDGLVSVSAPLTLDSTDGVTFGTTTVPLPDAAAGSTLRFAWRVESPTAPGAAALSPTASVPVFPVRPASAGGATPPALEPRTVDDGDAYVESAKVSADLARADGAPSGDRFSCTARMGAPDSGTEDEPASISLTLGGVAIVESAAIDERGRIALPAGTGRFDRRTGRLDLRLRGLDLSEAIVDPSSVPVRIEVSGSGLRTPVVVTTLGFDTRGSVGARIRGRFSYRASGTGNGVFQVTGAQARRADDGLVRVRLRGVIDAPLAARFSHAGGIELAVGERPYGLSADRLDLTPSLNGAVLRGGPVGGLRSVRIDLVRRTFDVDVTALLPDLAAAAPGTGVQLPVTLSTPASGTSGAVTYTTVATVPAPRR